MNEDTSEPRVDSDADALILHDSDQEADEDNLPESWPDDEAVLNVASGFEAGRAPERPKDDLVTRCLDDLVDDWARKGGKLSYDDVTRMVTKRALDGYQLANLLSALEQAGVTLTGLKPNQQVLSRELQDDIPGGGAGSTIESTKTRDALGAYLSEIGRYRLLWADDEVRLGRLIKTGQDADAALSNNAVLLSDDACKRLREASQAGRNAHRELVCSNLRLVVSIARRYAVPGMDLLDVIQEGNLGLLRAADKFDFTRGYKFSTYATWWIKQAISRGLADRGRLIRLPVHFHERLMRILRMQRQLNRRYGREPTLSELADSVDLDPGEVQAALDWARPVVSLDTPIGEGDITLGDLLANEADVDGRNDPIDIIMNASRQRDIDALIDDVLDRRSADIIRRRYGIGGRDEETLESIGQIFGVTRERIRQLESKALTALTGSITGRRLYEYIVSTTNYNRARPPGGWPEPEKAKKRRDRTHVK